MLLLCMHIVRVLQVHKLGWKVSHHVRPGIRQARTGLHLYQTR